MKVRWVLFTSMAAVLSVCALAYAGSDSTAPVPEAEAAAPVAGTEAETPVAVAGDEGVWTTTPADPFSAAAAPEASEGCPFSGTAGAPMVHRFMMGPDQLEAARQRIDSLIDELRASGDITDDGAARLAAELEKIGAELGAQSPHTGIFMQGTPLPRFEAFSIPPAQGFFTPSAPGTHQKARILTDGKSLSIEIDENGEVSVTGEGYSDEELSEIRRSIEQTGQWPGAAFNMHVQPAPGLGEWRGMSPDMKALTELELQGLPHVVSPEALRELELYGQAQPVSPEALKELEGLKNHVLSPEALKELQGLEGQKLSPEALKDLQSLEQYYSGEWAENFSRDFSHQPFFWHQGEGLQNFQLEEGWEGEVDKLMQEIGELLKQFMLEHQSEAAEPAAAQN